MMKKYLLFLAVAIVGLCLSVSQARADDTGAWVGGTSTDWTEATNWDPEQDPDSAGFIATFGNPGSNSTVDLGTNDRTIGQAIFNGDVNTTITCAGGVLTVDNSLATSNFTVSGGSHAINAPMTLNNAVSVGLGDDPSRSLTLGGNITGSANISRSFGLGTLTFGGDNSAYSGDINFDSYGWSASYPMGIIAIANTATGKPLGTGTLNIGGDYNNVAYAAHLDVGSGVTEVELGGLVYHITEIQGNRPVKFTGDWMGAQGHQLIVTNTTKTELAGNMNNPGGHAINIVGTNANIVISGNILEGYGGCWLGNTAPLTGNLTLSGNTDINWYMLIGGDASSVFTLHVASDGALAVGTNTNGGLQSPQNAQFYAYHGVTIQAEGGARNIARTMLGRDVSFSGSNDINFIGNQGGYGGACAVVRSAGTTNPGWNTWAFNGGKVNFDVVGEDAGSRALYVAGTTGTMIVNTLANWTGATQIAGATLQIDGTMAAGGDVTVNGGRLLINGTMAAAGTAVTVNGGTLGGNGIIYRGVTVNPGGTLNPGGTVAPGASIGILTVDSPTTIVLNGTLFVDVDGTGFGDCDLLVTRTSALDITGGTVNFNVLSPLDDQAYGFVNYVSLAGSGTFGSVLNLPAGYAIDYNYMSQNQIALVREGAPPVIPEPAGLGLIGVALLALRKRRS